jgi:hypothetical protein
MSSNNRSGHRCMKMVWYGMGRTSSSNFGCYVLPCLATTMLVSIPASTTRITVSCYHPSWRWCHCIPSYPSTMFLGENFILFQTGDSGHCSLVLIGGVTLEDFCLAGLLVCVLWLSNSESSAVIGIWHIPIDYVGGSENVYFCGLCLVARASNSK